MLGFLAEFTSSSVEPRIPSRTWPWISHHQSMTLAFCTTKQISSFHPIFLYHSFCFHLYISSLTIPSGLRYFTWSSTIDITEVDLGGGRGGSRIEVLQYCTIACICGIAVFNKVRILKLKHFGGNMPHWYYIYSTPLKNRDLSLFKRRNNQRIERGIPKLL